MTLYWPHVHDKLADVHRGKIAFVVGNGPGRKSVNLSELQKQGVLIGCNAIHSEIVPTYGVAVDGLAGKLLWEADVCPVLTPRSYQTRRDFPCYRWSSIGFEPFQQGGFQLDVRQNFLKGISGLIALQLAVLMGCSPIVLVGMEHTVEPGGPVSVYQDQNRPEYARTRQMAERALLPTDGGLVPISWLDSVYKIWWVCHLASARHAFFRIKKEGALTFLPVYGDRHSTIARPPGSSLMEFRNAFATSDRRQPNPSAGSAGA